jgi:hypothetical protein
MSAEENTDEPPLPRDVDDETLDELQEEALAELQERGVL